MAQLRAKDLTRHLFNLSSENPERRPQEDYTVPISFYIPENYTKKVWHYTSYEQIADILKAESKNRNSEEHLMAYFLKISDEAYALTAADGVKIKANFDALLTIANELTVSTSYPFYLKIKPLLSTIDKLPQNLPTHSGL